MVKNAPVQNRVSPGKIALIAVLALVLIVILVLQLGGDSGTTPRPAKLAQTQAPAANSSQSAQPAGPSSIEPNSDRKHSTDRRWPQMARDEVQKFNPFLPEKATLGGNPSEKLTGSASSDQQSPPEQSENPERHGADTVERENRRIAADMHKDLVERIDRHRRERRKALDELLKTRVGMLLIEPRGNMALIDKQFVRVGDVVSGFLITEINSQGVVFVDPESEPE